MRRSIALAALPLILASASGVLAQTSNRIYADQCVQAIGTLPDFSCAAGTPIPITQDRLPVENPVPGMDCDRPSLLQSDPGPDGQCVPHSRILNLSTADMMVAAMCRRTMIRDGASPEYDEIDVIAHNPTTGATCWFQAKGAAGKPVQGGLVPSPTAALDDSFWQSPETVAGGGCGNCHDNDPFMYSPYIGQVWLQVPAAPFGPYYHVGGEFGFAQWPLQGFDLPDNTCLSCHRIGIGQTCDQLTSWMTGHTFPADADQLARSYPLSHAMPPDFDQDIQAWTTIYGPAVDQIRSCCLDPNQPACRLMQLPKEDP